MDRTIIYIYVVLRRGTHPGQKAILRRAEPLNVAGLRSRDTVLRKRSQFEVYARVEDVAYFLLMLIVCCAGSIPEELGTLSELKVLKLNNNKLTGET